MNYDIEGFDRLSFSSNGVNPTVYFGSSTLTEGNTALGNNDFDYGNYHFENATFILGDDLKFRVPFLVVPALQFMPLLLNFKCN